MVFFRAKIKAEEFRRVWSCSFPQVAVGGHTGHGGGGGRSGGPLGFGVAATAAAAGCASPSLLDADVISPLAALRPGTRTRRRRRPERRVAQLRRRRRLAALAAAAAAALRAGMKRWHLLCKTIHWRGRGALGRCKLVNFSFLAPAATDGHAAARKDAR